MRKTVDSGHFDRKIGLFLFINLTKNPWDKKTRVQVLTSGAIRMFLAFLGKTWEHFKKRRVGEKRNPTFSPFFVVGYQLQTNGISKQFDAQKQDWTQIVDFLTYIKMLINFVYLSKRGIEICLFKGVAKHIS